MLLKIIYYLSTNNRRCPNARKGPRVVSQADSIEPYGEVLASQVFEKICNSVKYDLKKYDDRVVSDCKIFTSQEYGYKPISLFSKNGVKYGLPETLEIYREFDCEDEFRRMVVADCITLNSDRHFGNFGFLVNNENFERTAMNELTPESWTV